MKLLYSIVSGMTAAAFLLSFALPVGNAASWILGFLMLAPLFFLYRECEKAPRARYGKPVNRAVRGKVLRFPDAGRGSGRMD